MIKADVEISRLLNLGEKRYKRWTWALCIFITQVFSFPVKKHYYSWFRPLSHTSKPTTSPRFFPIRASYSHVTALHDEPYEQGRYTSAMFSLVLRTNIQEEIMSNAITSFPAVRRVCFKATQKPVWVIEKERPRHLRGVLCWWRSVIWGKRSGPSLPKKRVAKWRKFWKEEHAEYESQKLSADC